MRSLLQDESGNLETSPKLAPDPTEHQKISELLSLQWNDLSKAFRKIGRFWKPVLEEVSRARSHAPRWALYAARGPWQHIAAMGGSVDGSAGVLELGRIVPISGSCCIVQSCSCGR